jgi:hypothetical protein
MRDGKVLIKESVKNVINFMFKKGCKKNNITVAIGPVFLNLIIM